jgi:hypothetical protein
VCCECRLINYYYRQSLKFKTQVKRKWGNGQNMVENTEDSGKRKLGPKVGRYILFYYCHFQLNTNVLII